MCQRGESYSANFRRGNRLDRHISEANNVVHRLRVDERGSNRECFRRLLGLDVPARHQCDSTAALQRNVVGTLE